MPSMDLWLCPASLAAPDPPCQGGLTSEDSFCPRAIKCTLEVHCTLTGHFTYPATDPAALAPPAPGCVCASANTSKLRGSFFWPYSLTKPSGFMGLCEGAEPFQPSTELPLLQPRSRGESPCSAEHTANSIFSICSGEG